MSTTTPLSLYDVSIPIFTRTLTNLHAILTKASSDPKVSQLDLSTLRIHENMLAFPRQIQIACDTAKFYPVRVASHSDISFPDTETTLSDLLSRIQKTIDFLKEVKKEEFDDKLDVEVVVMKKFKFTGMSYTTAYSLPNFFFHVTTAYDILRMNGLDIGKLDYLGNIDQFTIKDQ